MRIDGEERTLEGEGVGSVEAFANAMTTGLGVKLRVLDYKEHAIGAGTDVNAVSYMELDVDGREIWGVGMHSDITTSSLRAIVSGVNRALEQS